MSSKQPAARGKKQEAEGRGSYVLLLWLEQEQTTRVGRLGELTFSAGWYAYAGSAHGPGGLGARVGRHLAREWMRAGKRPHWHVDYVRELTELAEVWVRPGAERLECEWSAALRTQPGAKPGPARLGASDCRCPGHLVWLPARPTCAWLRDRLGASPMRADGQRLGEMAGLLAEGEDDTREALVQDLARFGPAAVATLITLAQAADLDTRWWAVRALAACALADDPAALATLTAALDDPAAEVRACAALALGELGAASAAGAVAERLADADTLVASVASDALARMGEAAVPALVAVLRSGPPRARGLAARALERVPARGSVGALREALTGDSSYLVRHHARSALEALGELEPVILVA